MDLIELNLFGVFGMSSGGQVISDTATDKARALLTLLALDGEQNRTTVTALLWADYPQKTAFGHLRKTLYRLRKKLDARIRGADILHISSRHSLQLDPARVVVDVVRFQTLLAECDRHSHRSAVDCDGCLARLAIAVDLYRGELLAGFGLGDAPAFEEWLLLRREMLHQQALLALITLATAWETRGNFTRSHAYAGRSLALDPLREEIHRLQMRLLFGLGQRNRALQQYEQCRHLLSVELGVEPELATVALYEQIHHGERASPTAPPPAISVEQPVPTLRPLLPKGLEAPKWSEVPETGPIYGRQNELERLAHWLSAEKCQCVALLGSGGVGKTTLAAAVARAMAANYDRVIWRSLLNAPPVDELLRGVLQSMGEGPVATFSATLDEQLAALLAEARRQRCLLVLDNLESILEPDGTGNMRAGYEGYAALIRQLAERRHSSSLLLTSRERPHGFAQWAADLPWVRYLELEGLDDAAGKAILAARRLAGAPDTAAALIHRYSGHPLALKLVAQTIHEMFAGDIRAFLASDVIVFDDIRFVLDRQFERLPILEREILLWLAVGREPVSLEMLGAWLAPPRPMQEVVQALRALQRRSLLQRIDYARPQTARGEGTEATTEARFFSPNVIIEYLAERLIEMACREIEQEQAVGLHNHALMQAQTKEYVRQSQMRLLLQPVAHRLEARLGRNGIGLKVLRILAGLRADPFPPRGYAAGNLVNLLGLLEIDLGPLDLAGLCVWQADFRQINLAGSNLAGADLRGSRFADAFNGIRAVAVSPDGALVAIGTSGGEIRLWNTTTGHLIQVCQGHKGAVRSIAFRPDGGVLASGGEDHLIRLWRVEGTRSPSSQVEPSVRVLQGHTGRVVSVTFHPDGQTLVSGSTDSTVRIWNVASGETQTVLQANSGWVWAVAISPDGRMLASSGLDQAIRLWNLETMEESVISTGHTAPISSLAFDPTGAWLASGSYDYSACVWDVASRQKVYSFEAATDLITSVAFSPDGALLAVGGDDRLIRLWSLRTGSVTSVFHGHTDTVAGLAFSPDRQTLISGGADQQLSLWDIDTTRMRRLFSGYSQTVYSLSFHPRQGILASGHHDRVVRIWDLESQRVRQTLHGHTRAINSVVFSPDGTLLASGSDDNSIRMWSISDSGSARPHAVLSGHQRDVTSIDFHPGGEVLLSASEDQKIGFWRPEDGQLQRFWPADDAPLWTVRIDPTARLIASATDQRIRLWDAQKGLLLATLPGHAQFIWSLAFSPDGCWLASGGSDGSVGLWDVSDPTCVQHRTALHGHADRAFVVAFHPDGKRLVSGSADHTVRLWDLQTCKIIHTLWGHTDWVWTLAFSPDGRILASSGLDATIRLWNCQNGAPLGILRVPGPYAGMNISGVQGVSVAEGRALKLLGAVDH